MIVDSKHPSIPGSSWQFGTGSTSSCEPKGDTQPGRSSMAAREIADKRALTMGVSGSARLNRLWILIQTRIGRSWFEAVLNVLEVSLEFGYVSLN